MKQFLNLKTRTYKSKEFNDYMDSLDDNSYEEGNEWKASLKKDPTLPTSFESEVRVDPDEIFMFIENASLEAFEANPDNPVNDSVDVYLKSGPMITIIGTLKSFEKQLAKINS